MPSQSEMRTSEEGTPAPPELVARAEELVRKHPECFWFWHPDARVSRIEDVRLVVERLRDHGDSATWREAQDLQQCLLRHFK